METTDKQQLYLVYLVVALAIPQKNINIYHITFYYSTHVYIYYIIFFVGYIILYFTKVYSIVLHYAILYHVIVILYTHVCTHRDRETLRVTGRSFFSL